VVWEDGVQQKCGVSPVAKIVTVAGERSVNELAGVLLRNMKAADVQQIVPLLLAEVVPASETKHYGLG
jgi:hypothetical protein